MRIFLLQMGFIDSEAFSGLRKYLSLIFSKIEICDNILSPPEEAFNRLRNQYNSILLLNWIRKNFPKQYESEIWRALCLTQYDLYVPTMEYVFGQADEESYTIVSTYRLQTECYVKNFRKDLTERLIKECIHEIGHTFDLTHCINPSCVMHFSETVHDIDNKKSEFCKECRKKFTNFTM